VDDRVRGHFPAIIRHGPEHQPGRGGRVLSPEEEGRGCRGLVASVAMDPPDTDSASTPVRVRGRLSTASRGCVGGACHRSRRRKGGSAPWRGAAPPSDGRVIDRAGQASSACTRGQRCSPPRRHAATPPVRPARRSRARGQTGDGKAPPRRSHGHQPTAPLQRDTEPDGAGQNRTEPSFRRRRPYSTRRT